MSQTSISLAANDADLQRRVQAVVYDQAFNTQAVHDTQYAIQVRTGFATFTAMYWAVAVATEAAYAAGILNGRGSPGHDQDVISDNQIEAAVVANWPPDTTPPPLP